MDIKKELKLGIIANSIGKYSNVIIFLVIGAILARLLSPNEFGVVSIVMVIVTFINMLADLGLGPAVIQKKELSSSDTSSFFNFTFVIATLSLAVLFILAIPIAHFYNNPVYIPICRLLSLSVFFVSLNIVPLALLRRRKKFLQIAIINVGVNIITGAVAIILAFKGFSYYSLVLRTIIQGGLNFLMMFFVSQIRISPKLDFTVIKSVLSYSAFQFAFSFVNYFSRNADKLLIGKFLTPRDLGLYDNSYKLARYPVENLAHIVTPVLHPVFARYADNKDIIYDNYKQVVHILALIGMPISAALFILSREVILIVYGPQWVDSIPIFSLFALTIWIQMILSSAGAVFQACGRTDYLFMSGLISALVFISSILLGIYTGSIRNVALFMSIGYVINLFQNFFFIIVLILKQNIIDFILQLLKPAILGFSLFLYYLIERPVAQFGSGLPFALLSKMLLLFIIGITVLYLTGEHKTLINFFKKNKD